MVEAECSRMSLLLGLWAEERGHGMPLASPLNRREADLPVRLAEKAGGGTKLWHTGEHSSHRASPNHLKSWSTEQGEPIAEPSQETHQGYRSVADGSRALTQGRTCPRSSDLAKHLSLIHI